MIQSPFLEILQQNENDSFEGMVDCSMQFSEEDSFTNERAITEIILDLKSCENAVSSGELNHQSMMLPTLEILEDASPSTTKAFDYRRSSHVTAEKKRRKMIQDNLWRLVSHLPSYKRFKSMKTTSELDVIRETIRHVKKLEEEKNLWEKKIHELKKETDEQMDIIIEFKDSLPVNGIEKKKSLEKTLEERYEEHVTRNVALNWKYSIFSFISTSLFKTFKDEVSTSTAEEFFTSVNKWSDTRLSLTFLRSVVVLGLRDIGIKTSIITHPELFEEELQKIARKPHLE